MHGTMFGNNVTTVQRRQEGLRGMEPHVHISPVHMLAFFAVCIALFGTVHLLAVSAGDNRATRAWFALGF